MSDTKFEAVIFDCDGTLVDSEKVSIAVLVEYVGRFGFQIDLAEALARWAGGELPKVFAQIQADLHAPLPPDHIDQFRQLQMARLATDVEGIEGAYELVAGIQVPFCVASNAPLNKVELCLETSGLSPFFPVERRFSAYCIQRWKPKPDLFLQAAQALNVPATKTCAVVEDSLYGIEAGRRAGMHVFAFDPHGTLELPDDVDRVTSLQELQTHFHPGN